MRDRLYQSLLRSLQTWHTRSLPRETLPVKPGQPARHVAVQEAVELAQNELRWMVEDAKPHLPYGTHRQWRHNLGKAVSEMVRRRTVHHEPLAYILGELVLCGGTYLQASRLEDNFPEHLKISLRWQ